MIFQKKKYVSQFVCYFYIYQIQYDLIYRNAEHWITNTARGGKATHCEINNEISSLCESTSKAIGDGLLAIDLIETDNGLKVNEVNHKMEFRNSIDVTGVDIPMLMLEYAIKQTIGHNWIRE